MGKKNKQSKAPKLTGLAAALVKAGKLDEKKAKKLTREQRRDERKVGRDELERREAEKAAEAEARRVAEAEANRQRQAQRDGAAERDRAQRAVRDGLVRNLGGSTRWFFVARSGLVPFLEVDRDTSRQLQDGQAGIVESCGASPQPHAIVNAKALNTLHTIEPDLVRFWNR
jgi:hypothetical protein